MLLLLVCWAALLVFCLPTGFGILRAFGGGGLESLAPAERAILATWSGLLALGSALLGISLLIPLSPDTFLFTGIAAAAIAIGHQPARQDLRQTLLGIGRAQWWASGVLAAAEAFSASGMVDAYDTGLYQYQFTRWLAEFGTVPGLALVQVRLGQSSSWFALAAPFDFGPLARRTVAALDSLALFLCLIHWLLASVRILRGAARAADWFLMGAYPLLIAASCVWSLQASLSPDIPSWALTILAGWLLLSDLERGAKIPVLLFVAASAFCVKLSAVPILAVAIVLAGAAAYRGWTPHWRIVGALLPVIPVLLANCVASGFPLFPNTLAGLPVSWSLGIDAARYYATEIRNWALWGDGTPPAHPPVWWQSPWLHQADKLAAWGLCLICLVGIMLLGRGRLKPRSYAVLAIALGGVAFLLATLPNPRFGIGYLALFPGLLLAALSESAWTGRVRAALERLPCDLPAALVTCWIWLLLFIGMERGLRFELTMQAHGIKTGAAAQLAAVLAPPPLPHSPDDLVVVRSRRFNSVGPLQLVTGVANGIVYQRPASGDQCWGSPIPCAQTVWLHDVELRDSQEGLKSGFRRVERQVTSSNGR
jgi:hypothetical protein